MVRLTSNWPAGRSLAPSPSPPPEMRTCRTVPTHWLPRAVIQPALAPQQQGNQRVIELVNVRASVRRGHRAILTDFQIACQKGLTGGYRYCILTA